MDLSENGFWFVNYTRDKSDDVIYRVLLSRAITGSCFNFIPYTEFEIPRR